MNFSEKLVEHRGKKRMSQDSLADYLGMSRQAVSKWESGQSYPDADTIIALADLFNVTTDYLLTDAEVSDMKHKRAATQISFAIATILIIIGTIWMVVDWQAEQALVAIAKGIIIQAIGVLAFWIGKILTPREKAAPIQISISCAVLLVAPISAIINRITGGEFVPFSSRPETTIPVAIIMFLIIIVGTIMIKKRQEK